MQFLQQACDHILNHSVMQVWQSTAPFTWTVRVHSPSAKLHCGHVTWWWCKSKPFVTDAEATLHAKQLSWMYLWNPDVTCDMMETLSLKPSTRNTVTTNISKIKNVIKSNQFLQHIEVLSCCLKSSQVWALTGCLFVLIGILQRRTMPL